MRIRCSSSALRRLHDGVAVIVELAGFLFDLRLTAKEHTLGADDARAALVGERSEDVQDKGVVTVAGRRSAEGGAATEAAVGVFVAFLAEDLFLEFLLLLLVVRLLLRLQPPELVGEREIGEDQRELLDGPALDEGWGR